MKGLTDKQRNILEFINDFMEANVMAPTVYEIAEHFNIKTSTVFAHLRSLQKKNYLRVAIFTHGGVIACAQVYAGLVRPKEAFCCVPRYGGIVLIRLP